MQNFQEYIDGCAVSRLSLGKSGAAVYELTDGRIAKYVRSSDVPDAGKWASYQNEAAFYADAMQRNLPFLPQVLHCHVSEDEVQLILRKYRPLDRAALDEGMLDRIMAVLAQIHRLPVDAAAELQQLDAQQIAQCADGWRAVLAEHGDAFCAEGVARVARCINDMNRRLHSSRVCRCHGDFHVENLLTDAQGNVIVCDWQSTRGGHPAADIAFFLSRLEADRCAFDKARVVEMYCRHADAIAPQEIDTQMRLANVNTTFVFWHYFLHGASEDAVRRVYEPMLQDVRRLMGE